MTAVEYSRMEKTWIYSFTDGCESDCNDPCRGGQWLHSIHPSPGNVHSTWDILNNLDSGCIWKWNDDDYFGGRLQHEKYVQCLHVFVGSGRSFGKKGQDVYILSLMYHSRPTLKKVSLTSNKMEKDFVHV